MRQPWRRLTLAAALNVTVGVGVVSAQTVIVKKAPPGSAVELVMNADTVASATAGPNGQARLTGKLSGSAAETGTDVRILVDVCANLERVLLVERGMQPLPQEACSRREIGGVFVLRRVTSLVVDVGGPNPMVWLRQGPVPNEWLGEGAAGFARPTWSRSAKGLVLFGGGDFARFSNTVAISCGNVEQCSGRRSLSGFTVGAGYWLTPHLGAEASYLKPGDVIANGSGGTYRFSSSLDAQIFSVTGKVGAPIGLVRIYGLAGANYQRATLTTNETIDDVTVIIDETEVILPGGTQTFQLRTGGWGWVFGGGLEIWEARSFAIYMEGGYLALKGTDRDGGEASTNERVIYVLVGARVRIGR
jgi:Outer membrane protein beta-barrel domain